MVNIVQYQLASMVCGLPLRAADAIRNRRHDRENSSLLIARHPGRQSRTYRDLFRWIEARAPELRRRIKFCRLAAPGISWSSVGALTFWLADSIDVWSPSGHRHARRLEAQARQKGLPCINSIETLQTATKSAAGRLWNKAGLRAPRCFPVRHAADVLKLLELRPGQWQYPLLVRDDRGHGRPSTLIHQPADLESVPWQKLIAPIVAEYIDARSPRDGLYRKYRCVIAGGQAVPRHLLVNAKWEVRPEQRLASDELRQEELDFVSQPSAHAEQLVLAAKTLGLDLAGIDYSFTPDGELVLWEANPVPDLNMPPRERAGHLIPAVHRSFAAIAKLYLDRLGIETPEAIENSLQ